MEYIFLVAGKGSRLHPLTLNRPKSLYQLDEDTTVLKRMIDKIKYYDNEANIILVTGFMSETIKSEIKGVTFVENPFYSVTNSLASLWFVREYLDCDNVTIINGDIVMSEKLIAEIVCQKVDKPLILMDSSIKTDGDYNVQVCDESVLVMSKDLKEYSGEYAGITKLNRQSAELLKDEIELMVKEQMYDQWYENALVQMIFCKNFKLSYVDIAEYEWTEVDCVNDFYLAKKIHLNNR